MTTQTSTTWSHTLEAIRQRMHIPDDDPRYVASVRMISRKADSDHIVIVLEPEGIKPRYQQNAKKPWHVDVQYKPRQRWALLEECETPEQARARVLELGREEGEASA